MAFAIESDAGNWKLLGQADLMAGQYFFKDSAGSVNGYTDLNLSQARSFSADSGFFLNEHSVYSGFKQVNELAGGGTLFQQSLDNSLGAKWIKRFDGGFSLKPRLGIRNQLFRETSDEKWGKGLYDFWRYEGGVTWERKTRLGVSVPWTYQFSYDFYYTRYPRFESLSSEFGAALSSPDPGRRLLDTYTNQLSYRSEFDLPGFATAWFLYSISLVNFTDQKVVNSQGEYLSSLRSDSYQSLSLGYSKRLADWQALGRVRPSAGIAVSLSSLLSNQNNFDTDPQRLKFVESYYDYGEGHISPNVSLLFLKPMVEVRVGYDFGYRGYFGRLAQYADGSYTNNKLAQYTHSAVVDASYPLWYGLSLRARGIVSSARSNTHFEQTYTYNHTSYNYFAGIQWRL